MGSALSGSRHYFRAVSLLRCLSLFVSLSFPLPAKVNLLFFSLYQGFYYLRPLSTLLSASACSMSAESLCKSPMESPQGEGLLFTCHTGHSLPPPRPASSPNSCGQGGESQSTKHDPSEGKPGGAGSWHLSELLRQGWRGYRPYRVVCPLKSAPFSLLRGHFSLSVLCRF